MEGGPHERTKALVERVRNMRSSCCYVRIECLTWPSLKQEEPLTPDMQAPYPWTSQPPKL